MKKTKKKIRWLQFFSLLFMLAPIGTVIGLNADNYFTVKKGFFMPQAVEVSIGAAIAIASGVLLLLGKTKPLKGSRGLLIALVLSVFLKAIIQDLILILSALTIGNLIYSACQPKINDLKETFKYEKQAGIQAKAMENVLVEAEQKRVGRRYG